MPGEQMSICQTPDALSLRMSLSVIGCAAPARVGVEYCDHARPFYFESREQVRATPEPVRRKVLEDNKKWKVLCLGG